MNLPDTRSDRSFLFHGYRSRIGQPIGEEKRKSGRVRKYVKFIIRSFLALWRKEKRERERVKRYGVQLSTGLDRERAGKFLGSIPQLVKYATMVH